MTCYKIFRLQQAPSRVHDNLFANCRTIAMRTWLQFSSKRRHHHTESHHMDIVWLFAQAPHISRKLILKPLRYTDQLRVDIYIYIYIHIYVSCVWVFSLTRFTYRVLLNVLKKRCMQTAPEGSPSRPPVVPPASQAWVPQAHI